MLINDVTSPACVSCSHRLHGCLQAPDVPVGLPNLGNMCYANSALQCLFMIPVLRAGLFAVEEPLGSTDVILQIR